MKTLKPGMAAQLVPKLSFALLALLLGFALAPGLALSHAQIATSSPPNGAIVTPGLTQIILNFTEDVSPEQSAARLIGSDGSVVPGVCSVRIWRTEQQSAQRRRVHPSHRILSKTQAWLLPLLQHDLYAYRSTRLPIA